MDKRFFLIALFFLALFSIGFSATCAIGTQSCSGSWITICTHADPAIWTSVHNCAEDGLICIVGGGCGTSCSSDCAVQGAYRCSGSAQQQCQVSGSCLRWTTVQNCTYGCSGGSCNQACSNDCSPLNSMRCSGSYLQTCGNYDADSCYEWNTGTYCSSGCNSSTLTCNSACTNDCSPLNSMRCSGNYSQTCGDYDADSCYEWNTGTYCSYGCNSSTFTCDAAPVDGVCGATVNTCSAGSLSDVADTATNYRWFCLGSGSGESPLCEIPISINGACGTTVNTCSAGNFSDLTDTATEYKWSCNGSGGGSNVTCGMAIAVNGVCGPAAKTYTFTEGFPAGALCTSGTAAPSSVTGPTPFTPASWTCEGIGTGSSSQSCSATRAAGADECAEGSTCRSGSACPTGEVSDSADPTCSINGGTICCKPTGCVPTCTAAEQGNVRCDSGGTIIQLCSSSPGCLQWVDQQTCSSGEQCVYNSITEMASCQTLPPQSCNTDYSCSSMPCGTDYQTDPAQPNCMINGYQGYCCKPAIENPCANDYSCEFLALSCPSGHPANGATCGTGNAGICCKTTDYCNSGYSCMAPGAFQITSCPSGYTLDSTHSTCGNIGETKYCCKQQTGVCNTAGGYSCLAGPSCAAYGYYVQDTNTPTCNLTGVNDGICCKNNDPGACNSGYNCLFGLGCPSGQPMDFTKPTCNVDGGNICCQAPNICDSFFTECLTDCNSSAHLVQDTVDPTCNINGGTKCCVHQSYDIPCSGGEGCLYNHFSCSESTNYLPSPPSSGAYCAHISYSQSGNANAIEGVCCLPSTTNPPIPFPPNPPEPPEPPNPPIDPTDDPCENPLAICRSGFCTPLVELQDTFDSVCDNGAGVCCVENSSYSDICTAGTCKTSCASNEIAGSSINGDPVCDYSGNNSQNGVCCKPKPSGMDSCLVGTCKYGTSCSAGEYFGLSMNMDSTCDLLTIGSQNGVCCTPQEQEADSCVGNTSCVVGSTCPTGSVPSTSTLGGDSVCDAFGIGSHGGVCCDQNPSACSEGDCKSSCSLGETPTGETCLNGVCCESNTCPAGDCKASCDVFKEVSTGKDCTNGICCEPKDCSVGTCKVDCNSLTENNTGETCYFGSCCAPKPIDPITCPIGTCKTNCSVTEFFNGSFCNVNGGTKCCSPIVADTCLAGSTCKSSCGAGEITDSLDPSCNDGGVVCCKPQTCTQGNCRTSCLSTEHTTGESCAGGICCEEDTLNCPVDATCKSSCSPTEIFIGQVCPGGICCQPDNLPLNCGVGATCKAACGEGEIVDYPSVCNVNGGSVCCKTQSISDIVNCSDLGLSVLSVTSVVNASTTNISLEITCSGKSPLILNSDSIRIYKITFLDKAGSVIGMSNFSLDCNKTSSSIITSSINGTEKGLYYYAIDYTGTHGGDTIQCQRMRSFSITENNDTRIPDSSLLSIIVSVLIVISIVYIRRSKF